jgi:hypothetical protein
LFSMARQVVCTAPDFAQLCSYTGFSTPASHLAMSE